MQTWTSAGGALELDFSAWPLVHSTVRAMPDEAELKAMLSRLSELLEAGRSYALVAESRLSEAMPYPLLKLEAGWHKRNAVLLARHCLGVAMVVTNPTPARTFASSTVKSMGGRAAVPIQVFAEVASARAWAQERLRSPSGPAAPR